jgi:DNA-binding NarL/FixJ family response regulator
MFNSPPAVRSVSSRRQSAAPPTLSGLRVAVAAAGDLLLESIRGSLRDCLGLDCAAYKDTAQLQIALKSGRLDVLILDDLFDQTTWIGSLVEALRILAPRISIIIIGSFADGALICELLQAGIVGYLYRGDELRPLFEASLRAVRAHKPYFSPTASSEYAVAVQSGRGQHWHLDRESKTVLRMLASGMSVNEIAAELRVKPRHIYRLRTKLRKRFNAATNEAVIVAAALQGYLRGDKE